MVKIFAVAGLGYLILVGTMFAAQRRMMYFPDTDLPDPVQAGVADMAPIRLETADGLTLTSWYRPAQGPNRVTLVYFHGNAGHIGGRGDKVRPYLNAGHGVLLVGYRGYGGNPGTPTEDGLYADGRAALTFLTEQGIETGIVLYGESLGTGVAVRMASEHHVAAVVLEAPYTSIADVAAAAYRFVPVRLLLRDRFDSLSRVTAIGAPLYLLHGEQDTTIPVHFGRRLFAAAAEPKQARFFAGAGHTDLYEHGGAEAVLGFIASLKSQ